MKIRGPKGNVLKIVKIITNKKINAKNPFNMLESLLI